MAVVVAYVGSQFVDVTLATVGDLVLSVQKVTAIVVLPLGAILLRRLRWSSAIAATAAALSLAYVVAAGLGGQPAPTLASDLFALILNAIAALVLYAALLDMPRPVQTFGRVWCFCAVVTSMLALGQVLGVVPLMNVPDELLSRRLTDSGLLRASGLKADPNFAAMMMTAGVAFTAVVVSRPLRLAARLALFVGVAATLSRMGMIVAAVLLLASASAGTRRHRISSVRMIFLLPVAALLAIILYGSLPPNVQMYVDARFWDLGRGAEYLLVGADVGTVDGSGVERADLLLGTLTIIAMNPLVGVGPNNLQGMLYANIGIDKGAHNTYLEIVAIGGIFGLFAIGVYVANLLGGLRRGRTLNWSSSDVRCAQLFCLAVGLMAAVLTIVYNAMLWIPLTLACVIGADASSRVSGVVTVRSINGGRRWARSRNVRGKTGT
ncbi:MAG: O-antigen ligase family protein [Micropruina sp.]|uniref:O-antigen ligase family protein n=1 Tax=Micropruina sp. TaxID=2737536 RepID=UPI0039E47AA2